MLGGYIVSLPAIIDAVRSFALSFIFTAGALASVRHFKASNVERERHQERAAKLKRILGEAGIPVMPSETRIVPVLVGDPVKCKRVTDILLDDYGIYIQPINYPTVPRGPERLRITPSPVHSDDLLAVLIEVWAMMEIKRAA